MARRQGELVPRPELAGLDRCAHGAVGDSELAALGLTYADVIDFSVNSNPLGPSPSVRAALASVDPSRYPDDDCRELREVLAARAGVESDRVIVGNGSSELLWLIALAYLRPGDSLLALTPTFGEYERAARLMGARVETVRSTPEREFWHDLAAVVESVARLRPRVVYLGNPNNPTGVYVEPGEIVALAETAPETLFVVDEAYLGFVERSLTPPSAPLSRTAGEETGVSDTPNLLRLRSLTKDYALAGLRLGYSLAVPEVVRALRAVQPPWSVSAAAQAAGLAAIADEAHLRAAQAEVIRARDVVETGLTRLGLRVYPSACNFVLAQVGDARAVRAQLLARRCVVRDCASFGLPDHVRIGLRTVAECERLVEAFGEVIACPARL